MPSCIIVQDNNIILCHLKTTEFFVCPLSVGNIKDLCIRSAWIGCNCCNPGKLIPSSEGCDHRIQDRIEDLTCYLLVSILLDVRINGCLQCIIVAHILIFWVKYRFILFRILPGEDIVRDSNTDIRDSIDSLVGIPKTISCLDTQPPMCFLGDRNCLLNGDDLIRCEVPD